MQRLSYLFTSTSLWKLNNNLKKICTTSAFAAVMRNIASSHRLEVWNFYFLVVGQINYTEDMKRFFYLPEWLEVVRKPHTHTNTWRIGSDWIFVHGRLGYKYQVQLINTLCWQ